MCDGRLRAVQQGGFDRESFMTNAIKDNLEKAGFGVGFCPPNVNELNRAGKSPIILLYLGDFVENAGEGLIYLKDKALEDEARLFVVGSNDEIKEARVFLTDAVITRTFERPLNVKQLVDAMNETSAIMEAEGDKKHILIVDDDAAHHKGMARRHLSGDDGEFGHERHNLSCKKQTGSDTS